MDFFVVEAEEMSSESVEACMDTNVTEIEVNIGESQTDTDGREESTDQAVSGPPAPPPLPPNLETEAQSNAAAEPEANMEIEDDVEVVETIRNTKQRPSVIRAILVKPGGGVNFPLQKFSVGSIRDSLDKVNRLLYLNMKEKESLDVWKKDLDEKLELGEKINSFIAQASSSVPQEITIESMTGTTTNPMRIVLQEENQQSSAAAASSSSVSVGLPPAASSQENNGPQQGSSSSLNLKYCLGSEGQKTCKKMKMTVPPPPPPRLETRPVLPTQKRRAPAPPPPPMRPFGMTPSSAQSILLPHNNVRAASVPDNLFGDAEFSRCLNRLAQLKQNLTTASSSGAGTTTKPKAPAPPAKPKRTPPTPPPRARKLTRNAYLVTGDSYNGPTTWKPPMSLNCIDGGERHSYVGFPEPALTVQDFQEIRLCEYCVAKEAHFMCAACSVRRYCSKKCQSEDWAYHGLSCGSGNA